MHTSPKAGFENGGSVFAFGTGADANQTCKTSVADLPRTSLASSCKMTGIKCLFCCCLSDLSITETNLKSGMPMVEEHHLWCALEFGNQLNSWLMLAGKSPFQRGHPKMVGYPASYDYQRVIV